MPQQKNGARKEIKDLERKVQFYTTSTIITFKDGTYTTEFTELVYKLLEHHVGNMNIQRLAFAQKQLGDELAKKEKTCLYSDETRTWDEKYMAYHLSDDAGRHYVLGIRDLATKSLEDTMNTFTEVLQDIEYRSVNKV